MYTSTSTNPRICLAYISLYIFVSRCSCKCNKCNSKLVAIKTNFTFMFAATCHNQSERDVHDFLFLFFLFQFFFSIYIGWWFSLFLWSFRFVCWLGEKHFEVQQKSRMQKNQRIKKPPHICTYWKSTHVGGRCWPTFAYHPAQINAKQPNFNSNQRALNRQMCCYICTYMYVYTHICGYVAWSATVDGRRLSISTLNAPTLAASEIQLKIYEIKVTVWKVINESETHLHATHAHKRTATFKKKKC